MDVENLINKALVNDEPMFSAYIHSRAIAKGVPVSGTFELTSRCNFNCRMCYVHNQDSALCKSWEKSAEWWIELGKKAASEGMVFLLITGGEPLLRPDFKEIYTELSKLGLMISINTNGSLLCGEIAELFKKNPPTRLNISLYGGSDETYERFTGLPYFTRVIENIKLMKSYGIDIRLNVSITKDNYQDAAEIYRLSRELGVRVKAAHYMYPQVLVGAKSGENQSRLCADSAAKTRVDWYKIIFPENEIPGRFKNTLNGVESLDEACIEDGEDGKVKCRAGRSSFWVTSKGEMCFCGVAGHPFSIDELGFKGAWDKVREFSASIRTPAKCEACKYKNICCVCAAACYTETGDFSTVPEYVCRMTERIAQLMKNELERLGADDGN